MNTILMSWTGEEIFALVFLLLFLILVPSAGIYAHRRAKRTFAEAEAGLRERGYAKTKAYQKGRGDVTWIGSLLAERILQQSQDGPYAPDDYRIGRWEGR